MQTLKHMLKRLELMFTEKHQGDWDSWTVGAVNKFKKTLKNMFNAKPLSFPLYNLDGVHIGEVECPSYTDMVLHSRSVSKLDLCISNIQIQFVDGTNLVVSTTVSVNVSEESEWCLLEKEIERVITYNILKQNVYVAKLMAITFVFEKFTKKEYFKQELEELKQYYTSVEKISKLLETDFNYGSIVETFFNDVSDYIRHDNFVPKEIMDLAIAMGSLDDRLYVDDEVVVFHLDGQDIVLKQNNNHFVLSHKDHPALSRRLLRNSLLT